MGPAADVVPAIDAETKKQPFPSDMLDSYADVQADRQVVDITSETNAVRGAEAIKPQENEHMASLSSTRDKCNLVPD